MVFETLGEVYLLICHNSQSSLVSTFLSTAAMVRACWLRWRARCTARCTYGHVCTGIDKAWESPCMGMCGGITTLWEVKTTLLGGQKTTFLAKPPFGEVKKTTLFGKKHPFWEGQNHLFAKTTLLGGSKHPFLVQNHPFGRVKTPFLVQKPPFGRVKTPIGEVKTTFGEVKTPIGEVKTTLLV